VTERQQPGRAIDGRPEVVAFTFVGRAGVDRHAHAKSAHAREVDGAERALRVEGCEGRRFRRRKRRAERIADRFENVAVPRGDRFAHQLVVRAHRLLHGGTIACPALRAALDIAEQKRYRAGRCGKPSAVGRWAHGQ
jgi:hypothetical protein